MNDDANKPEEGQDAAQPDQPDEPQGEEPAGEQSEQAPSDPPPATPVTEPNAEVVEDFGEISDDEKTMAMLGHLLGIIGGFVAPLIIWLIKKDESKFVDDQGKEALNFQITILIGYLLSVIAGCVTACLGGFGVLLAFPVWVISIVFCIMGGLAAKEGKAYRYPVTIRIIK